MTAIDTTLESEISLAQPAELVDDATSLAQKRARGHIIDLFRFANRREPGFSAVFDSSDVIDELAHLEFLRLYALNAGELAAKGVNLNPITATVVPKSYPLGDTQKCESTITGYVLP